MQDWAMIASDQQEDEPNQIDWYIEGRSDGRACKSSALYIHPLAWARSSYRCTCRINGRRRNIDSYREYLRGFKDECPLMRK